MFFLLFSCCAAYDYNNIFARIIKADTHKYLVYNDENCMAFLDTLPAAPGHTLLIPKSLGAENIGEMSAENTASLFGCLPRVITGVKKGMKVDSVNVLTNLGKAAEQTVFHPHIHIVPKYANSHYWKQSSPKVLLNFSAKRIHAKIVNSLNASTRRWL